MAFNSLGFLAFFAAVCAALALTNIPAAKRALGDKLFGARHVLLIAANYVFTRAGTGSAASCCSRSL